MATDVLNLMDAMGLERVKLLAHDWGGWIAFILCVRAPERFSRYLALNIPHLWAKTDPRTLLQHLALLVHGRDRHARSAGGCCATARSSCAASSRARRRIRSRGRDADVDAFTRSLQEPARARRQLPAATAPSC